MSGNDYPSVIPSKIGREFMRKLHEYQPAKLTAEEMKEMVRMHQESARLNLLKFENGKARR
jgi:cytochrome bd-type quinol oxidase subunit 1